MIPDSAFKSRPFSPLPRCLARFRARYLRKAALAGVIYALGMLMIAAGVALDVSADEPGTAAAITDVAARHGSRWIKPLPVRQSPDDIGTNRTDVAEGMTADAADIVFDEVDIIEAFYDLPLKRRTMVMVAPVRGGSTRVVIHSNETNATEVQRLLRAIGNVEGRGMTQPAIEQRQVDIDVGERHVRYFHDADRAAAEAVAEAMAAEISTGTTGDSGANVIAVRNFTHYRPSPRQGLVEVWTE